jgi:hypothetical protein
MCHSTKKTAELVCTTIPPATVSTSPSKPISSYVVGDAFGCFRKCNPPHPQDQPRPSPPLKQYRAIESQQEFSRYDAGKF